MSQQTEYSLKIDVRRAARRLEQYIKETVESNHTNGVLIGLSGGIDSAVLATVAVGALGSEKVKASFLYDQTSEKNSQQLASLTADWLGMELGLYDIEPAMRERKVYSHAIMRIASLSRILNRLTARLYRLLCGQSPFVSSLYAGSCDSKKAGKDFYSFGMGYITASFNARHIYRRQLLEKIAGEKNLLLLGAANRSECMVGWFVKDGIDDLPFSPLMGLYKTQIRQLAEHLDLPGPICSQVPSPDMLKGVTDEQQIGISYAVLDTILDCLESGLGDEEIAAATGATKKQITHVRSINRLSEWKRKSPHQPVPADGGIKGGLRIP